VMFHNKRAVGVKFMKDGKEKTVKAKREVILSGGTIGSTQLLLLSGVGPKDDLNKLGCAQECSRQRRSTLSSGRNRGYSLHEHILYGSKEYPDFQLYLLSVSGASVEGERFMKGPWYSTGPIGQVVKLMKTKALAALGTKVWDVPLQPCKKHSMWSNEYNECMAKHLSPTSWHQCCTNPMGNGKNAVVDPRLRVRGGITGLRVVDASVMPDIVTGNLNAAVYMIAEKGAAMILEDNK
ncbi:hypothetical protein MTO96_033869, partial [Rhipicephalus appendiculatus]